MWIRTWLLAALSASFCAPPASADQPPVVLPKGEEPLVDLAGLHPQFLFDIRYATADNFFEQKVYPVARCALRQSIARRMVRAQTWLDAQGGPQGGYRLLFKDCYRPDSVQWVMWKVVKGTPKAAYVANPESSTGSIHGYGAAVDLTLADHLGRELDLGTPYDFLGELAEPRLEARFLQEGKLTKDQVDRRHVLAKAMREAGMSSIPNEWWHFNAQSPQEVKKRWTRLNVPLESIDAPRPPAPRQPSKPESREH